MQGKASGNQKAVFDGIAESWHNIRSRQRFLFPAWFGLFNSKWKPGGRVLDVGCGDCKHLRYLRKGFVLHAMDISRAMTRAARANSEKAGLKIRFRVADAARLPYKTESMDYAICTAVYHHLETGLPEALHELHRVLKPGGEAFITVWYRWKKRFLFRKKEELVPWHTGGKVYRRYYRYYSFREFRNLLEAAGFGILKEGSENGWSWKNKITARNACFLVGKPQD
jgi:SAM-dependent methyltransferase